MAERFLIPSIFGTEIGVLMEGKNGLSFQYHKEFDAKRYPVSPLMLPYDESRIFNYYDSMPFKGLPGIFADSLPDSFGSIAMEEYFKRKNNGLQLRLSALEKLAYIGSDGIGAIEYRPAFKSDKELFGPAVDLRRYVDETKRLIEGNAKDVLNELISHPSPGGARPKAAILWDTKSDIIRLGDTNQMKAGGLEPWIIKFDEQGREDTKIESVYMKLASSVGIEVPEMMLLSLDDEAHFAIKRFDRDANTHTKYHQATLSGLLHKDFMHQNACSYEEYLRIAEILTKSPAIQKEAFRRMVFNVIGRNCDDHIKNFSFLMNDSGEWQLSPAYDLIYSDGVATFGEHKMSINGKNNDILLNDIAQCGYSAGLEKSFMQETVEKISTAFSGIKTDMLAGGVSTAMSKQIENAVKPISTTSFPQKHRQKNRRRGGGMNAIAARLLKKS